MDSGLDKEESKRLMDNMASLDSRIDSDVLEERVRKRMKEDYKGLSDTEKAMDTPRGLIFEEAIRLAFIAEDKDFEPKAIPPFTTWIYTQAKDINDPVLKQRLISEQAIPGLPLKVRLGNDDIDFGKELSLEGIGLDFSEILFFNDSLIDREARVTTDAITDEVNAGHMKFSGNFRDQIGLDEMSTGEKLFKAPYIMFAAVSQIPRRINEGLNRLVNKRKVYTIDAKGYRKYKTIEE